jgi:hypothetical protein
MNVQITMTVDLDEIPAKTAEMLDERAVVAQKALNHLRATVINNLHNGKEPTPALIDEIDKCRRVLYLLDTRLADAQNHLSGWLQNKITPKTEKQLLVEGVTNNEEG